VFGAVAAGVDRGLGQCSRGDVAVDNVEVEHDAARPGRAVLYCVASLGVGRAVDAGGTRSFLTRGARAGGGEGAETLSRRVRGRRRHSDLPCGVKKKTPWPCVVRRF
jgi:hypothetical protein